MGWIDVSDYLPMEYEPVLASVDGKVKIMSYEHKIFIDENNNIAVPDAWMPLPVAYRRGKHEAKHYDF